MQRISLHTLGFKMKPRLGILYQETISFLLVLKITYWTFFVIIFLLKKINKWVNKRLFFYGSFLSDRDCWEGWCSILACSLMAVETDSWCALRTALWTDKGLGWGWSGCCSLFLPAVFFVSGFVPLFLELTTGFSHWWAPAAMTDGWSLTDLWPCHWWLCLENN